MDKNNIEELLLSLKLESDDSNTDLRHQISSFEISDDISMIQNQFDVIYTELMSLKTDFEKYLKYIQTTELVQNLINYKMYEIEYNFMVDMKQLENKRDVIESSNDKDSQVASAIVEWEKKVSDVENTHEESYNILKEQKLEAQEAYERTTSFLDNLLEIFKKQYQQLIALLQAEKDFKEVQDGHLLLTNEVEQQLEQYKKLQTKGWTVKMVHNLSEAHKTLKITTGGLLLSKSGMHVPYKEVKAKQLLDRIELYERVNEETTGSKYKRKSKGDTSKTDSMCSDDGMASEDVNYLKEHLGVPLTLALAEITSVQPRDPIHYLGHWLFKYRYNQEIGEIKKQELQQLLEERQVMAAEKWRTFVENEARAAVIDMIVRAEEEGMQNELIRIANELDEEEYETDLESEARDKFDTYR